jgi:DNA polymerase-3 subunit gamma/tau
MVGQEHVLRALTNALDTGRLHHAFLFTGTRGVGKTTLARILAKSLNCESGISAKPCGQCQSCQEIDEGRFVDLIEVDAASRTKVEDTRDLLDNVQYAPTRGRFKVYLIDEVHMLSGHSFNALLKTLEEPPPHVKFLLATTDPQRLPVTILSRCLQFNLKRLHPDLIVTHLQQLLANENITYEDAALKHLARAADGSMRDALSLLDQSIAFGSGQVLENDVRQMLGTIEHTYIYNLLDALSERDGNSMLAALQVLNEQAPDYNNVLSELLSVLHAVALIQQIPDSYDEAMGDHQQLEQLAQLLAPEDIQLFYQIGVNGRRDLPLAPDMQTGFEMIMLRMLAFRPASSESASAAAPATPAVKQAKPVKAGVENKTPTSAPAKQVVTKPAVADKQPVTTDVDDWEELVNALSLGGVLNQLAMNCVLQEKSANKIVLLLDPACENLLTKDRQDRLREELEKQLSASLQLEITAGQGGDETPAQKQARLAEERRAAAEVAIQSDSNVQKIVDAFGAQINPDTIQPVD